MDRRLFLKNLSNFTLFGLASISLLIADRESMAFYASPDKSSDRKNAMGLLKEIYREVTELGKYENDDFTKREFLMNLDHNDRNKEEHVVFLSHNDGEKEKITIQVTYFEPARNNNLIKYAKETKVVQFYLKANKVEIEKCDYDESEVANVFFEILQGIRNKKELLKLIKVK